MPERWASRVEKVLWISKDKEAGDQCRSAFRIVMEWIRNPPVKKVAP